MPARRRPRRRSPSGHLDPLHRRRRRFEDTLGPLGLWEPFAAMPRWAQDLFLKRKIPDPTLEFDPSADAEGREMRPALEAALRGATVEVAGREMPVRDFIGIVAGCLATVRHSNCDAAPESARRFVREAGPVLERHHDDFMPAAAASMYDAVTAPLLARSRTDGRVLGARLESRPTDGGKVAVTLVVVAARPQVRRVALDGRPRRVFRVGDCDWQQGVRWVEWEDGRPVFVQSHALRQLRRRVDLPAVGPYLEAWLAHSLAKPVVVERQAGGDLLVEFRLMDRRVGYLVATPTPEAVVVRTFLFLTMAPSPEARRLERRLRLGRHDAGWLGLHELSSFTRSDLGQDATLRPLMEACGCGHLFDLDASDAAAPRALAAEVKRYLRLAA